MKKMWSCLIMVVILVTSISIHAFARTEIITDKRTGVTYEAMYQTEVAGDIKNVEYDSIERTFIYTGYYKSHSADVTSEEVKKSISDCNKHFMRPLENLEPGRKVMVGFSFLNGYRRTLDENDKVTSHILKYFGISKNLLGTKVVTKQGVPFTFKGDGKGNITVEVITNEKSHKNIKIELPVESEYWKKENIKIKYHTYYMRKDGLGLETAQCDTLEEALDKCAANADLEKTIRIEKQTYYGISYFGKVSDLYILDVDYGLVGDGSVEDTSKEVTNKTEAKPTELSSNKKNDANEMDTVQSNEIDTDISDSENTTIKEDGSADSTENITVNEKEDGGIDKNTENINNLKRGGALIKVIISVAVIVVIGSVVVTISAISRKKKK